MRDLDRLRRMAAGHGEAIGVYAAALLDIPLPWTKMRQVYALFGLVKKWGPERVDAACRRALEAEAVNVGLIGRMLERGTEEAAIAADAAGHGDPGPVRPRPRPLRRRRLESARTLLPPRTPDRALRRSWSPVSLAKRSERPDDRHRRHPRAQSAAAPGQARPLPRHPPRTTHPRPHRPDGPRRVPRARPGRRGHPPRNHLRRPPARRRPGSTPR